MQQVVKTERQLRREAADGCCIQRSVPEERSAALVIAAAAELQTMMVLEAYKNGCTVAVT